jgi:hypothetical protein
MACVQFDLDLTLISGGVFPGLISVGLSGEVRQIPQTKCYGWNLELFLQISIGFEIGSLPFRISFVMISTLSVQEQPLDIARGELMWELPFGYDTSMCHTPDPFTLVERTLTEQWSFIASTILPSSGFAERAEKSLQDALKDYDANNGFDDYLALLRSNKPWSGGKPPPPPEGEPDYRSTGSLVKDGKEGAVKILGSFVKSGAGSALMTFKADASLVIEQQERQSGIVWLRLVIWQDVGEAIMWKQFPKVKAPQATWRLHVKDGDGLVAQVQLLDGDERVKFAAPVHVDPHDWDPHLNAHVQPIWDDEAKANADIKFAIMAGGNRFSPTHPGRLALEEIHANTALGCTGEEVLNSVQLKIGDDTVMKNTWTPQQFGNDFPWGVTIDLERPQATIPREAATVLRQEKPMLSTGNLDRSQTIALLKSLNSTTEGCRTALTNQLTHLQMVLSAPSRHALDVVETGILTNFIVEVLWQSRDYIKSVRPQDIWHDDMKQLRVFLAKLARDMMSKDLLKTQPTGPKSFVWEVFHGRSVNQDICTQLGRDALIHSMQDCKDKCIEKRPQGCKDGKCGAGVKACNAARLQRLDGGGTACGLWYCTSFDRGFPKDKDAYDLAVYTEEPDQDPVWEALSQLENVPAGKSEILRGAVSALDGEEQALLFDAVAALLPKKAKEVWKTEVRDATMDDSGPKEDALKLEALAHVLDECMFVDLSWARDANITKPMLVHTHPQGKVVPMIVSVAVSHDCRGGRGCKAEVKHHAADFEADFFAVQQRSEPRKVKVMVTDVCPVEVRIKWIWSLRTRELYFRRPKLVPVAQAFFAAYDQFVTKLPVYSAQVVERLTAPVDSWWDWLTTGLPYGTTDGRYLHRNMKTGVHDHLKIHEGDLIADDAVFNYPKALSTSQHSGEPAFLYNVGLSLANLFVRALGDIQAMFFLYFADHPDWDGDCNSLPAKFNLYHEQDGKGLPTHRAGATVGEKGEPLSEDERAAFLEWHWVSMPFTWSTETQRAAFFKQTAPIHGKDMWATPVQAELGAEMWPHVWCELVEEYWVKDVRDVVRQSMEGGEASAAASIRELLSNSPTLDSDVDGTISKPIVDSLRAVEQELSETPPDCPSEHELEDEAAVRQMVMHLGEGKWKELAAHQVKVLDMCRNTVAMLRKHVINVSKQNEDKHVEKTSDEVDHQILALNSVEDNMHDIEIQWKDEQRLIDEMLNSTLETWAALKSSNDLDPAVAAVNMQAFKTARNKVEMSLRRKKEKLAKMEQTLFKVLNDCKKAPLSAISEADYLDYSEAYTYGKSLSSAVQLLQKRAVAQVQVLYACFNLHSRPDKLPADRFGAHFSEATAHRDVTLKKLKDEIDPSTISGFDMDGIDFFFQEDCQVPVDADFAAQGRAPGVSVDETAEPRHECERVVLSKAFLTLLPSLSTRAVSTFKAMQAHLASLRKSPHRGLVNDMVLEVTRFLKSLDEGLDDDFFTAFAYIREGSLYGDLWESLPQAATTIVATLEERTKTRRSWVEESISQKSRLTTGRRARIRRPVEEESEIPTAIDGCVCQDTWSGWQWRMGLPHRVYLDGCSTAEDAGGAISGLPFDAAEVPGFCRVKQKKMSLVMCRDTFARCDPKVTKDTRPTYSIWRAGHSNTFHRSQLVKLPLVQVDVFMNFDLRNFRGDYCTPNFAPLLIKYNYHYSAFSWSPWEVRRTNCLGARLHPPGVSLLLVRCQRGSGDTVSVEWELVGSAYLIAYYNTWGTSDGDMMESWFTGSWGGNMMDKITGNGLAGLLKQSIWSGQADGYGYLMTDQVMQSGPAFWLATIAEVIGAYNVASLAVDKEDGQSVSMFAMVSAVATGVWRALQRYGAVPAKWGVDVSLSTVTKALETVGGVVLSPWRNEHDVLLSFKYSRHSYSHKRTAADMIDRLSTPQVRAVLDATAEHGASASEMTTDVWWRTYQQRPSHGPEEIANLGRDTMIDMIELWALKEGIKPATQELFTSCKHRPRWYKVAGPGVYAFWSMKHSSWMQPEINIGTEVILMSQSEGWRREVNDESEEARFWPDGYSEQASIRVAAEVVQLPRSDDTTVRTLTEVQFHRVLQATNNKDLRCWAQRVSEIDRDAVMHARFRAVQKYSGGIWGNVSAAGSSDRMLIPPEYFDSHYNREFLDEFWGALQKEANSTERKSLSSVFARGSSFTPKPSKDGGEKAWTVQSSTALGLSLMHRIGLSFIKIPGILQVQPYFQLKFDFNIKKLLSAISMRVRGADPDAPSSASVLQHYRKRQDKCLECVRKSQGFCDRERPAESMLVGGRTDDMDDCEDRTVERKNACRRFLWHTNVSTKDSDSGPGKVFENQVCPCFDRVTGQNINPRWITSEEHCKEMRWPATDDEKDRRETKASDWQFGFLNQASGRTHNLLVMGDDIAFDGRKACHEGFRCCGARNHVGEETLRCVEEESLQRKGSWLFNNQKCKYFDPSDFEGVRWSHIRDEFRCAPVDKHNAAFDGHWWVDPLATRWSKKAGLD